MERGDYLQTQHAPYGLFGHYNVHIKKKNEKKDFPKISTSDGWDLILHESEGSKTFQRDNTSPCLKESAFYIRRGHTGVLQDWRANTHSKKE